MIRTYDHARDWLTYVHDAYWGGQRWRTPSSPTLGTARIIALREVNLPGDDGKPAGTELRPVVLGERRTYLVQHDGESEESFDRRIQLAAYINMVQPVVDTYADSVTARVSRDLGALAPYMVDLDGQGGGWQQHVEGVARWSATFGMYAVLFDTPSTAAATTLAEELAAARAGEGIRAVCIPPTAWAWVDVDQRGRVEEFAYVDAPYQTRDAVEEVTLWRWNRAGWERHTMTIGGGSGATRGAVGAMLTAGVGGVGGVGPGEYGKLRGQLGPETLRESGALPSRIAGTVPVVFSYYRRDDSVRWPQGVSLVADAADICRQVFNLLSSAEEQIRKTAFSFLSIPTADRAGGLSPDVQVRVGSDHALPHPAEAGPPQWVQPKSETTREIREHALFLLALVLRLAGLEASADGDKSPASGVALRIRSRGFEARAARFAQQMANYETRALALVSRMLGLPVAGAAGATPELEGEGEHGERPEQPYTVTYPKRFTLPDSSEDLERALSLLREVGSKLGPEGFTLAMRQALDAALSLSDDELGCVLDEVRARLAGPDPDRTEGAPAGAERPGAAADAERPSMPPPPAQPAPDAQGAQRAQRGEVDTDPENDTADTTDTEDQ